MQNNQPVDKQTEAVKRGAVVPARAGGKAFKSASPQPSRQTTWTSHKARNG